MNKSLAFASNFWNSEDAFFGLSLSDSLNRSDALVSNFRKYFSGKTLFIWSSSPEFELSLNKSLALDSNFLKFEVDFFVIISFGPSLSESLNREVALASKVWNLVPLVVDSFSGLSFLLGWLSAELELSLNKSVALASNVWNFFEGPSFISLSWGLSASDSLNRSVGFASKVWNLEPVEIDFPGIAFFGWSSPEFELSLNKSLAFASNFWNFAVSFFVLTFSGLSVLDSLNRSAVLASNVWNFEGAFFIILFWGGLSVSDSLNKSLALVSNFWNLFEIKLVY